MPLSKDYQRFGPSTVYGCISGDKCNVVMVPDKTGQIGTYVASGCGEKVALYNIRTRELMALLPDATEDYATVCRIRSLKTANSVLLAAGYTDGWVRIINAITGSVEISMRNHSKAITSLVFSDDGSKLICGSRDKEITILDMATESGYRLKGHSSPLTCVRHIPSFDTVVSSSTDGIIKFWDLKTKTCFKTLPAHQNEVRDLLLLENGLLLSASDRDLQLWRIGFVDQKDTTQSKPVNGVESDDDDDGNWAITAVDKMETIERSNAKRIESLVSAGQYVIVIAKERKCEIFWPVKLKKKKKLKDGSTKTMKWKSDMIALTSKIVSADAVTCGKDGAIQILFSMVDNSVELRHFSTEEITLPRNIRMANMGHRFPVHTIEISEDGNFILSVSKSEAKLWNKATGQFVTTLTWSDGESQVQVSCASFAPGERHIIFGSEEGTLMLFDIASRRCLANIAAHDHMLTSVTLISRRRGAQEEIVTGSMDSTIKLWKFCIIRDADSRGAPVSYTLELHRHVETPDKVTNLCAGPDGRIIAVALLDTSIRLLLADSLKTILALRGHSMPVRSLDISSDSTKLVTGSDDKTIRVWGLQFGDCQTVFQGHDNVITGVRFLPRSGLLVSASKDRTVRLWDGVKFRRVMILRGHQDFITALSVWRGAGAGLQFEDEDVNSLPHLVVSAARDHTIRLWEELEELVVLEEEEEIEREREYAEELANEGQPLPGDESERMEHQLVSKRTLETVKAAERIMEGIDEVRKEREVQRDWKERQARLKSSRKRKRKLSESDETNDEESTTVTSSIPPENVLFAAYGASTEERFMLEVMTRIRLCDLERALIELPLEYVADLLPMLATWVEKRWNIELATRCFSFLLDLHKMVMVSNQMLIPAVRRMRLELRRANMESCRQTSMVIAGLEMVKVCR